MLSLECCQICQIDDRICGNGGRGRGGSRGGMMVEEVDEGVGRGGVARSFVGTVDVSTFQPSTCDFCLSVSWSLLSSGAVT
jgi:hypothetical protein